MSPPGRPKGEYRRAQPSPSPTEDAVVAVAYSGGPDSMALLHATCVAAQALGGLRVVALHVHHGLLPQADAWLAGAQALCRRWARRHGWALTLRHERLQGQPGPADSVEAWARAGRHAALQRLAAAEGATLLLLGQHRRDQAETVLLQALRGAGPAGLAAMPRQATRSGIVWARPWLLQPRDALHSYVRAHRLKPVDDPSNHDSALARGRLRQQLWPVLQQAFPALEPALVQLARRAHEADAALQELAALDLASCTEAYSGADSALGQALRIDLWARLSDARRANSLRHWLSQRLGDADGGRAIGQSAADDDAGPPPVFWTPEGGGPGEARSCGRSDLGGLLQPRPRPPDSLVRRLLDELPQARHGRWPLSPHWQLQCYRQRLSLVRVGPAPGAAAAPVAAAATLPATLPADLQVDLPEQLQAATTLDLSQPGWHRAPDAWQTAADGHAGWWVEPVTEGGAPVALLQALQARPRRGGEQLSLAPLAMPRALKKQYQARGVPPPLRHGPLLWAGPRLLYAPGLGIDARCWAAPGSAQLGLRWCDNGPQPPG